MRTDVNLWLGIPAIAAAVAWTTFVVWYWIRASWWKSQIGQNVMILGAMLSFSFIRLALIIWTGPVHTYSTGQVLSGFFTYTVAAAIGVQRTYLMEKAQREYNVHDRAPHPNRRWDD